MPKSFVMGIYPHPVVHSSSPRASSEYDKAGGVKLSAETLIKAPLQKVWAILTDFESYPEWNPFITEISGVVRVKEKISVTIFVNGKASSFKPVVRDIKRFRLLSWQGRLLIPGLFDGHHEFLLRENGSGEILFTQREVFRGLLVKLILPRIRRGTLAGYRAMNEALKNRAEAE